MQAQVIIQQLGITPNRFATIVTGLFGEADAKLEFTQEEAEQVEGVVKFIRLHNERSVKKAVEAYRQGIATESRVDPRKQQFSNSVKPAAVEGLGAALNNANETAKVLAERQVTAILELTNTYVADWLVNGIPVDVISQESLERLQSSSDEIYAATLGKIDSVGNYLPALAQEFSTPKKLLSAAID